jgi:hypothetical protein
MDPMVMRTRTLFAALVVATLGACSPPPCAFQCMQDGGDAGDADTGGGDADADVASITIAPTDSTIVLRDSNPQRVTFSVVRHRADGTDETLSGATFRVDDASLGTFDGDTFVTAGGIGRTMVRATVTHDDREDAVSTSLAVSRLVEVTHDLSDEERSRFDVTPSTDSTSAPPVLYPLDGALFPENVPAPRVQWRTGVFGDLYRVVFARPNATLRVYARHTGSDFGFVAQPDRDTWQSFLANEPASPIAIHIERVDAATHALFVGASVSISIAQAPLFGEVYYWQLPNADASGPTRARLARIDVASGRRDLLLPSVPYPTNLPTPPGPDSLERCVGCHAISHDGRYVSTLLGSSMNAVFDLTDDLDRDPAPTVWTPRPPQEQQPYYTSSFNADGTRLVVSAFGYGGRGNGLAMIDPRSGMSVATQGLPGIPATGPRWSPDGRSIAFIANGDDSEAGSATGDLSLLAVGTAPDSFTSPRVLHQGGDLATAPERGTADARPAFTPDSAWVAFQHGPSSISRNGAAGALYLVATSGGTPIRLHNASGGIDGRDGYFPSVSPFVTSERDGGRHYWIAFYARRAFGNDIAGTMGTRRPQLWVTAVDASPQPGVDPSHVPFWLEGQDTTATSMAPDWAGPPCVETGERTRSAAVCCSQNAAVDPSDAGASICAPPASCHPLGGTCSSASECCAGLSCEHHVCVPMASQGGRS